MKAVILADGLRSCLQSLTENRPRSIGGGNYFIEHSALELLPRPSIVCSRGLGGPSVLSITPKNTTRLGQIFGGFLGCGKRVVIIRKGDFERQTPLSYRRSLSITDMDGLSKLSARMPRSSGIRCRKVCA